MLRPTLPWAYLLASACGGQPITSELDEPLQVRDAQFVAGPLPGKPPLTGAEIRAGVMPESPRVTSFDFTGQVFHAGDSGKNLRGRASADADVVGLALAGAGQGYFIVPLGSPDPNFADEYTFLAAFDVGYRITPGKRQVLLAALDGSGRAGTQQALSLCIAPDVPDNLNACDPKVAPPEVVISLEWDAAVDLDLTVVTPSGSRFDAKHPRGTEEGADAPTFTRDAGAGCTFGGAERESLVFQKRPPKGRYLIYANLFSACARGSTRYNATIHGAAPGETEGTFRQVETFRVSGVALGDDANSGQSVGRFLTQLTVE